MVMARTSSISGRLGRDPAATGPRVSFSEIFLHLWLLFNRSLPQRSVNFRNGFLDVAQVGPEAKHAETEIELPPQPGGAELHAAAPQHSGVQSLGGLVTVAANAKRHARELRLGNQLDRGHRSQALVRELREDQLLLERGAESFDTVELEAHPQPQAPEVACQLGRVVRRREVRAVLHVAQVAGGEGETLTQRLALTHQDRPASVGKKQTLV